MLSPGSLHREFAAAALCAMTRKCPASDAKKQWANERAVFGAIPLTAAFAIGTASPHRSNGGGVACPIVMHKAGACGSLA
jgi:hypothetical protein